MDVKIIFIFLIIMAKLSLCKDTPNVTASRNATSVNSTNITNILNTTNATNFTIIYVTHGRQYENNTIPLWGFNSTCKWVVATYVDLSLSGMGVVYNAFIFLLPFFFARLYNARGGFMCSYAIGCFLCSSYYVYFDLRILFVDDVTRAEKGMLYILMLFLAYHVILHVYLLTWDQYRTVFHCRGHLRYATTSRLYKLGFIVWVGSIVLPVLETIFLNNFSHFPQTYHVSDFRLVCVIIILFFFWFLPLMFMTGWNGDLFCFLLKLIHNGYVIKEHMPVVFDYKPELMPELAPCPWRFKDEREKGDDDISHDDGNDPAELATIPDDTRYEFTRCFVHLVVTTLFASPLLVWLAYHLLAMLRTGDQVSQGTKEQFYKPVYNCHVFICLYVWAKLIAILNPLCYFYYRPEIHRIVKCVMPWMSSENIAGSTT